MLDKATCREKYKSLIHDIKTQKEVLDKLISDNLSVLLSQICNQANYLGAFKPLPDEPQINFSTFQNVTYPRVSRDSMKFHVQDAQEFEVGAYNILEPTEQSEVVLADAHDVFVVPGLSFSNRGFRLGRGKGFYDKYLSSFKKIKIGVGYFCSQASCMWVPEEHDISMNYVVTDKFIMKVV